MRVVGDRGNVRDGSEDMVKEVWGELYFMQRFGILQQNNT